MLPSVHEVERAPRQRSATRRTTEMGEAAFYITLSESGACGILVKDVRKNAEFECLERDRVRAIELADLVMRQIELPEEHRLGGLVETIASGEALTRKTAPRRG